MNRYVIYSLAKGPNTPDAIRETRREFSNFSEGNLLLLEFFQRFERTVTVGLILFIYLVKIPSTDFVIYIQNLKIRVALMNRVRCVWAFIETKD